MSSIRRLVTLGQRPKTISAANPREPLCGRKSHTPPCFGGWVLFRSMAVIKKRNWPERKSVSPEEARALFRGDRRWPAFPASGGLPFGCFVTTETGVSALGGFPHSTPMRRTQVPAVGRAAGSSPRPSGVGSGASRQSPRPAPSRASLMGLARGKRLDGKVFSVLVACRPPGWVVSALGSCGPQSMQREPVRRGGPPTVGRTWDALLRAEGSEQEGVGRRGSPGSERHTPTQAWPLCLVPQAGTPFSPRKILAYVITL